MIGQAVVAGLLTDGYQVARLERPPLGGGRSPDFLVRIGATPVAIEVVDFRSPPEVQKAAARVRSVEQALKVLLAADAVRLGARLALSVRFRVDPLQDFPRPAVQRDAARLAADIRAVLPEGPVRTIGSWRSTPGCLGRVRIIVRIRDRCGHEKDARLRACPDTERGLVNPRRQRPISTRDTPRLPSSQSRANSTTRRISLRRSRKAAADLPWWRVYDVWGGGRAVLVFDAPGRAPHLGE
jgi:hypothetical protein